MRNQPGKRCEQYQRDYDNAANHTISFRELYIPVLVKTFSQLNGEEDTQIIRISSVPVKPRGRSLERNRSGKDPHLLVGSLQEAEPGVDLQPRRPPRADPIGHVDIAPCGVGAKGVIVDPPLA